MRLIITLFTTLFLLTSCGIYDDLSLIGEPNVELKGFDDGRIKLDLVMKIKNPNSQSFTIKDAAFDIYINDNLVGHSKLDRNIKIKGNSTENYRFPIGVKLDGKNLSLGMLLGSIFQSRINLKIEGHIKAGAFLINQRFPVEWAEKISL
jgi:LEA14-like dessication related protein